MPTGVWRKTYLARKANPEPTEKLPSVKGLHKAHFYKMPSKIDVQADRFLLDVEPIEPEDKDLEDTEHGPIATLYKESRYGQRGKAS
jgi:hypothetical protein